MKAIRLENPREFRVIDIPEPASPAPGEAVVTNAQVDALRDQDAY